MSATLKFIETHFWAVFTAAFVFGLFTPAVGLFLRPVVVPAIMILTFLTLLRADFEAVGQHLKRPLYLIYLLAGQLFIIPVLIYVAVSSMNQAFAVSCLLLAAMPPAIAAVALTEFVKGDTSLSLTLTVLAHGVAPLSVTALFFLLTGTSVSVEWTSFARHLALIILLPMGAALIVRRVAKDFIGRHEDLINPSNVLLMSFTLYVVAGTQSETIISDAFNLLPMVVGLYGLFLALFFLGHVWAWRSDKSGKIAVSVTNAYMNNGLAIALAFTFFEPEVVVLAVLSEIPWMTTLAAFCYVQQRLLFNRYGSVS